MFVASDDHFAWLARDRVSHTVARSSSRNPLVVLRAPPGYGKTTAMRQFVAAAPESVVWLTLRAEQTSVRGFSRALLEAVIPEARERRGVFDAPEFVEPNAFGLAFAGRGDVLPRTIVLDDFALAASDPKIVALAEAAIERTRDRCSWLIATREASLLPIARWCANGLIDEPIDERELRFDSADARALARSWGFEDDHFVDSLLEMTDGWPHAFSLGLHCRLAGDSEADVFEATRSRMHAFFTERVIEPSSEAERRFFLETCVFEEISPDMLDALGPEAVGTMARIRAATVFVDYGPNAAFRFHPVFREFLRDALSAAGATERDRVTALALRTLDAVGRHADGIRLAMSSDPAILARTLRCRGLGSIDRGEFARLREALALLPRVVRETDPDMMNLVAHVGGEMAADFESKYGAMLAREASATRRAHLSLGLAARLTRTGRAHDAAAILERTGANDIDDAATRARFLAESAALRSHWNIPEAIARIDGALALVDAMPDDELIRALVHRHAAAIALADERFDDAVRHGTVAVDSAVRSSALRIELRARAVLYRASLELARFDNARAHLTWIRLRAAEADDLEMTLFALASASDTAADSGDEAWLDEIDVALEGADTTRGDAFVESLNARLGDVLVRSRALRKAWAGRYAEAFHDLDRIAHTAPARRSTAAELAIYAAACGDVGRASGECARIRAGLESARTSLAPGGILARLLVAVASIICGDEAAFVAAVSALESIADRLTLPHICFLRALRAAHDLAGNRTSRRTFAEQTDAMATHGLGGYAALLVLLPVRVKTVVPASVLTAREVKVLELLCDDLTSREIASRLGRSVLTIDSHVKMIVKKLHCTGGRREAVAMARAGRIAGLQARLSLLVG